MWMSSLNKDSVNSIVSLVGTIKEYITETRIVIVHMHNVLDFNECIHHFLEVIHVHLQNTRRDILVRFYT